MISWTPRSFRTLPGLLGSVRGQFAASSVTKKSGSGTKRSPESGRHNSKRDEPFLNTLENKMRFYFKSDNKIGADLYYKVLRYTVFPWLKVSGQPSLPLRIFRHRLRSRLLPALSIHCNHNVFSPCQRW